MPLRPESPDTAIHFWILRCTHRTVQAHTHPTTAKLGKNLSGLKRFILETAVNAGGKPCPPYGIGIGIGGQMDIAAKLSRKAISTRRWDDVNPDPELAALEAELKDAINGLGLGAAGTGGDTVCLALKMERAQ